MLEVYRNIVTRPKWTTVTKKDLGTKTCATISHTLISFGIREAWILTYVRCLFRALGYSSQSADFPNKVSILFLNTLSLSLLAWDGASTVSLGSVTVACFRIFFFFLLRLKSLPLFACNTFYLSSSLGEQLGHFHLLAMGNNVIVDTDAYTSLWALFLSYFSHAAKHVGS